MWEVRIPGGNTPHRLESTSVFRYSGKPRRIDVNAQDAFQNSLGLIRPRFGVGSGIDLDKKRFWDKVNGEQKKKIWENIVYDQVVVNPKKGIGYPAPWIQQPTFTRRSPGGGSGQGEGNEGDPVNGKGQPGQGSGQAGKGEGNPTLESWMPPKAFMTLLKEKLKLPNLKPKPGGGIPEERLRHDRQKSKPPGPILLLQTFKKALKRSMAESEALGKTDFDPATDITFHESDIIRQDYRVEQKPRSNTVVFSLRDISGSMGEEEKARSRIHAWLMEMLLRDMAAQERATIAENDAYTSADFWDDEHFKTHFIVHTESAQEVERDAFYNLSSSGGTNIASAYKLTREIIEQRFPASDWNIYVFHFTDGDNLSDTDNEAIQEINKMLLLGVNRFSLIDVRSVKNGAFTTMLANKVGSRHPFVSVSSIKRTHDLDEYARSIKTILDPVTEEVQP